jgi:AraC-like DNA-binding protein
MSEIPEWFLGHWTNTAFRVDGMFLGRVTDRSPKRSGQRDLWTFKAVTEGRLRISQGAWANDLGPGDQTLTVPDSAFTCQALTDECEILTIDFRLEATGLGSDPLPSLVLPAVVHIPLSPEWLHLLHVGLESAGEATRRQGNVLRLRGAADSIIGWYLETGIRSGAISVGRRGYAPDWLAAALRQANSAFWDPHVTPAALAKAAGFSRSHYDRVFKAAFGQTPVEHIWEQRLQMAARKLDTDPALPVGGIAQNCGFKSHTHFTRMFHRRFGMTPGKWHKRFWPRPPESASP